MTLPELSPHGHHQDGLERDASVETRDPRLLELSGLGAIDLHEACRQRRAVPLVAETRPGLVDREVRHLIDEDGDSRPPQMVHVRAPEPTRT